LKARKINCFCCRIFILPNFSLPQHPLFHPNPPNPQPTPSCPSCDALPSIRRQINKPNQFPCV